jgi:hypothetical protein
MTFKVLREQFLEKVDWSLDKSNHVAATYFETWKVDEVTLTVHCTYSLINSLPLRYYRKGFPLETLTLMATCSILKSNGGSRTKENMRFLKFKGRIFLEALGSWFSADLVGWAALSLRTHFLRLRMPFS